MSNVHLINLVIILDKFCDMLNYSVNVLKCYIYARIFKLTMANIMVYSHCRCAYRVGQTN